MNGYLRQSTASQTRSLGPFVDDTDFKSAETGLTIANTDVKLVKNGAASVDKNSGGGTHRINGVYSFTFDATDTNTVGELEVSIAVSGALIVLGTFVVLDTTIYDALYSDTPSLLTSLDIGQLYEGDITVINSPGTSFDLGVSIATDDNWIGNIVTVHDISTGDSNTKWVTDVDQVNDRIVIDSAPTFTVAVGDLLRVESRIHPVYANSLQNDVSTTEVNAEVDTALSDIHLDHLLGASYDQLTKPGDAASLLNSLIDGSSGAVKFSATALEEGPASAVTAASIWAHVLGSSGFNASQLLQICGGALAGKLSGASTTTITIRNIEDTGDIIVATVDEDGNRSAITITNPST
jgi:hypothetical protein